MRGSFGVSNRKTEGEKESEEESKRRKEMKTRRGGEKDKRPLNASGTGISPSCDNRNSPQVLVALGALEARFVPVVSVGHQLLGHIDGLRATQTLLA